MTKKETQAMAARIVGILLTIIASGGAGWTAVVLYADEKVDQIEENTTAHVELKATHKEDIKAVTIKAEKLDDKLQQFQIEQGKMSTTLAANSERLKTMDTKMDLILSRLPR